MKRLVATINAVLTAALILTQTRPAAAHMAMSNPAPLRHKNNPHTDDSQVDYDYIGPMSASGSDFPCKGHLDVYDTAQGSPVVRWTAGQRYSMTISGGTIHDGGSCQASLSFDGGRSFTVIHSWIGNCPSAPGDTTYGFTLPGDTPSADKAIFAWSWFNKLGNREMYMNCAAVSISGGSGSGSGRGGFDSRPGLFVANVGNGCGTVEAKDLMFPSPGPDVDMNSDNTAAPTGNCEAGPGAWDSGNMGTGTGSGSSRDSETDGHEDGREEGDNGHKPGNDWPDWFKNDNEASLGSMLQKALLFQLVVVVMIHLNRPIFVAMREVG